MRSYPKTSHIAVSPVDPPSPTDIYNVCYTVEGVAVGSTYLMFNATTADGQVISSRPREIQVFAPLQLMPETITLLPTATFQVWRGGEGR